MRLGNGEQPNKSRKKNSPRNALFALAVMMLLSGCDSWNLRVLEKKCANAGPYNIQDQKLWENYIKIHEEFYRNKINYYLKNRDAHVGLMIYSDLEDEIGGIYLIENKLDNNSLDKIYRYDYTLSYKNPNKKLFKRVANIENYKYTYHDQIYSSNNSTNTKNCVQDYSSAYLGKIVEEINERR